MWYLHGGTGLGLEQRDMGRSDIWSLLPRRAGPHWWGATCEGRSLQLKITKIYSLLARQGCHFLIPTLCPLLQSCMTLFNPMDCSPPGSLSMGFPRQGYWSGLPFPPPGDLLHPGIEPASLMSLALARSATWEASASCGSIELRDITR